MPEVRDWEPRVALAAGADGLDVLRWLVPAALPLILPGGFFLCELGKGQAPDVAAMALAAGYTAARALRDYAGVDRFVIADRGE